MKYYLFLLSFLFCVILSAQSDYFVQFNKKMEKLSASQKVDTILAIPFEVMNSQTVETIDACNEGLKIAKQLKDNIRTGLLYEKVATSYYYKGDYDLTLKSSLNAVKYYEKAGDKDRIGSAYASLGYQMKRRNLPQAFIYMKKGVELLEVNKDDGLLSAAYNNYGVLFEMNQDLDSALYYYFKGLKIVRSKNDSLGIPYSLNNIGMAYVLKREYGKALRYYDEAFAIRKLRNDKNGIAENHQYYGDLYFEQGNHTKAIEHYKQSLQLSEEIKYTYLSQVVSEQLARSYEHLGDYKQSLIYRKKHQEYKDKLLNDQTNSTVAQLEVQFETEKKEKEIIEQNAQIIRQEAEAKQRNYVLIGLSVALLLLIVLGVNIYRQQKFKQERLLAENRLKDQVAAEQLKNKVHEERLRISRDLHDNIGSQLTFLTSSMDNMKYMVKEEKINNKLNDLTTFTRSTISQLRDTIWAMNKGSITIEDLQGRLLNYIEDAKKTVDAVAFDFVKTGNSENVVFSATQGVHLFRIVQESINNALKYAMPSTIIVEVTEDKKSISISIQDDGIGFNQEEVNLGNGLKNMEQRAKEIGATFSLRSTKEGGTLIFVKLRKDKLNAV